MCSNLINSALHSTASQSLSSSGVHFLRKGMGTHAYFGKTISKCHFCVCVCVCVCVCGVVLLVSVFAINWRCSPLGNLVSLWVSIGFCEMDGVRGTELERGLILEAQQDFFFNFNTRSPIRSIKFGLGCTTRHWHLKNCSVVLIFSQSWTTSLG